MKTFSFIFRGTDLEDIDFVKTLNKDKILESFSLFQEWLRLQKSLNENFFYVKFNSKSVFTNTYEEIENKILKGIDGGIICRIMFLELTDWQDATELILDCPIPYENWTVEIREINQSREQKSTEQSQNYQRRVNLKPSR